MQSTFSGNPLAAALRRQSYRPGTAAMGGGGMVGRQSTLGMGGQPTVERKQQNQNLLSQDASDKLMEMLKSSMSSSGSTTGFGQLGGSVGALGSTGATSNIGSMLGSYGGYGGLTSSAGGGMGLGSAVSSGGLGSYGAAPAASGFGSLGGTAGGGSSLGSMLGSYGGGAGAGGSAAGGASSGLAAAGPWAALAAIIGLNEEHSRKKGFRDEDRGKRLQDQITGKVVTQDLEGKWGPMMDKWTGGRMSKWGLTGDMKAASQIGSGRFGGGFKTFMKEGTPGKLAGALKKLF